MSNRNHPIPRFEVPHMDPYIVLDVGGALLGIVTVLAMLVVKRNSFRKAVVIAWLVIPPILFLGDYYVTRMSSVEAEVTRMKERQELASRIWIGVGAALAVIYLKDVPAARE
jgi:uncharacterized membrane protein YjfL (UPF0719 family)